MKTIIFNRKEFTAEKIFLSEWLELCGYLTEKRLNNQKGKGEEAKEPVSIFASFNNVIIEIQKSFLQSSNKDQLKGILSNIMSYYDWIEQEESFYLYNYRDDRNKYLDKVMDFFIENKVYYYTYIAKKGFLDKKMILNDIKQLEAASTYLESLGDNDFTQLSSLVIKSKMQSPKKGLTLFTFEESTRYIEKSTELKKTMKLAHYQDSLSYSEAEFYQSLPGEYQNVWQNLRLIEDELSQVNCHLGFLKAKYWKQKDVAYDFYKRAAVENKQDYSVLLRMADILYEKGHHEKAGSLYKKSLSTLLNVPIEKEQPIVKHPQSENIYYLEPLEICDSIKLIENASEFCKTKKEAHNMFMTECTALKESIEENIFLNHFFIKEDKEKEKTYIKQRVMDKLTTDENKR